MMQVVSNLDLWTRIQVGLTLRGDKNSQVTNGAGDKGWKRERKNSSSISEVFGNVTLDESCFCGLCHCPVWIVLYSLVPTSLPQLCLLHHCFTHMLSWNYQDVHIVISCWELDAKVSISGSCSEAMASIAWHEKSEGWGNKPNITEAQYLTWFVLHIGLKKIQ